MKPQPLARFLEQLMKSLGIERTIKENQVLVLWPEIVGKRISQVTEPHKVKDGVLFVRVKSASWRSELIFYKKDMLTQIDKRVGKHIISDILFI